MNPIRTRKEGNDHESIQLSHTSHQRHQKIDNWNIRIAEMTFVLLTGAESRLPESNAKEAHSGTTDYDSPSGQCKRSCAAATKEIISKRLFEVLEHSKYSPDLAPCDFFLFLALKQVIRDPSSTTLMNFPQPSSRQSPHFRRKFTVMPILSW